MSTVDHDMAAQLAIYRPYAAQPAVRPPAKLVTIRPYLDGPAGLQPKRHLRAFHNIKLAGIGDLPAELRVRVYTHLFEPLPATIEFGQPIPKIPAVFQAIPEWRRADLKAYFMRGGGELAINLDSDLRPAEIESWVGSGICERLQHFTSLRLVFKLHEPVTQSIEVAVRFRTGEGPAWIDWVHEAPFDEHIAAFKAAVDGLESRTPMSRELAKLLRPCSMPWFVGYPAESNVDEDNTTESCGSGELDGSWAKEDGSSDSECSETTMGDAQSLLLGLGTQLPNQTDARRFLRRLEAW